MKKIIVTILFANIFNSYSQQYSIDTVSQKLSTYKTVRLSTDLSGINETEKEGLKFLVRAAEMINEIFKLQAFAGHPITDTITNEVVKKYMEINYGPWDRLSDNKPFINGIGPKPLGANYYPADMRQTEFDSLTDERKNSPYSIIVREKGQLVVKPYNEVYSDYLNQASMFLRTSAGMLQDAALMPYLLARADALLNNTYDESDKIWLQMKGNKYDIIIGPIENYEDQLYGLKTSYEAYVLVKDIEWSKRLEKYVAYLPELQKNLPVENGEPKPGSEETPIKEPSKEDVRKKAMDAKKKEMDDRRKALADKKAKTIKDREDAKKLKAPETKPTPPKE
jgi:hypothetical protein